MTQMFCWAPCEKSRKGDFRPPSLCLWDTEQHALPLQTACTLLCRREGAHERTLSSVPAGLAYHFTQ